MSEVSCLFSELPEDMQVLIIDFVCAALGDTVYERVKDHRFTVQRVRLRAFPRVTAWSDYRGFEYAEAMIGVRLPPVLICGDHWLDGRHRVWAARREKMQTITCIDLSEVGMTIKFPTIGMLRRK